MNRLPRFSPSAKVLLQWLLPWRGLVTAAALAGLAWVWLGQALPLWQQILLSVALLLMAGFSLWAGLELWRGQHRGRVLSLFVDYLAFVACFVMTLSAANLFLGIDALADTFAGGLPGLGILLVGYLLTAGEEISPRMSLSSDWQTRISQIGRWVMALGGVVFLWGVQALQGFLYVLGRLAQPGGWLPLAATLLFGAALWAMNRPQLAESLGARASHEQLLSGWLFLSPNLLGFLIFFAGPLLLSFYFSFTDSDAFNTPHFIGLENYARIFNITLRPLTSAQQLAKEVVDVNIYDEVSRFTLGNGGLLFAAQDKFFWLALKNTLIFALFAVPLSVLPALLLANLLNSKLPGMKFFRAVYFLPSIAAIVGIALVWQWLYNATVGYINYFITLGVDFLNTTLGAGMTDPRIRWVSDEKTALLAIIIISAWQTMGFNTVLFLAGLQNIPGELYEAATVDGAGAWRKFWDITLPLLAPSTFYVLTTTSISAMQVFEQVFILMNPPEGPNNATITLVLYLYRSGFQNFKQGYASAIAWVLFIVIFGITLLQFQRQRKSNIYEN